MPLLRISIIPKALPTPQGNGLRFEALFISVLLYYRITKLLKLIPDNHRLISSFKSVFQVWSFSMVSFPHTFPLALLNNRAFFEWLTYPNFIRHRHF